MAAARALIGRPEIIIADEPTSALDRDRQVAFLDLLFCRDRGRRRALIMVSHDETLAARFDRVVRFDDVSPIVGKGARTMIVPRLAAAVPAQPLAHGRC